MQFYCSKLMVETLANMFHAFCSQKRFCKPQKMKVVCFWSNRGHCWLRREKLVWKAPWVWPETLTKTGLVAKTSGKRADS